MNILKRAIELKRISFVTEQSNNASSLMFKKSTFSPLETKNNNNNIYNGA